MKIQAAFIVLALSLSPSLAADPARAKQEVERIARDVLTNPVIEEFSLRLEP